MFEVNEIEKKKKNYQNEMVKTTKLIVLFCFILFQYIKEFYKNKQINEGIWRSLKNANKTFNDLTESHWGIKCKRNKK